MQYLPLSVFFIVMNVTPFLVAILACLWLKEKISIVEVFCMIGAFGGILLVSLTKPVEEEVDDESGSDTYNIGLLCALGSAFCVAITLVTTRKLKALSVYVIQWYYALTSTVTTAFCIIIF